MKSSISRRIGKRLQLGRTVWRDESYDHWLRNGQEYENIISYIDQNPVKAKLCNHPNEWEFGSFNSYAGEQVLGEAENQTVHCPRAESPELPVSSTD